MKLNSEKLSCRILNIGQVLQRVPAGRSTIYRWANEGVFPKPKKFGRRKAGWLESEIADWINKEMSA